jgi:hypothetical protein
VPEKSLGMTVAYKLLKNREDLVDAEKKLDYEKEVIKK